MSKALDFVASVNYVRPRYLICLLVHCILVLIRGAMVIVSIGRLDRNWTFPIERISTASSITNFVATVFSATILGISVWALAPLALHRAFTRPQSLTAMHDRISAWFGPGAAVRSVWRNRDRRPPALLVVTLVYFIAAWAVSSTFSPSFTFENFNNTVIFYPTLDSITTALTSLGDIGYMVQSQDAAAYLVAAFAFLDATTLSVFLTGLGNATIYDTLASPAPPTAELVVPGLAAQITCGEVPQSNWTLAITPVSTSLNVTVNGTLNQRPMGVSFSLDSDWIAQMGNKSTAVYKFLQSPDPVFASRNLYILSLGLYPSALLTDSQNSAGSLASQPVGSVTAYYKVIGCSLSMSNTTVTIDGLNRAVNDTDMVVPPPPHPWSNALPVPSRGMPWEDLLGALYTTAYSVQVESTPNILPGGPQFSLFEALLNGELEVDNALATLERCLVVYTTYSFAVLGARHGYTLPANDPGRAVGWDPKPTSAEATLPVLRARLRLPRLPTVSGFIASVVCLLGAMKILGNYHATTSDEELIGDPGPLYLISMLRRSSIPFIVQHGVSDAFALDEDELRRFGTHLNVRVFEGGHLDVIR